MKNLEKLAKSILSQNPKLEKVYVCEDRNVFASEKQAKEHCEKQSIKYHIFDRNVIVSEKKETKKTANKSKTTKNK